MSARPKYRQTAKVAVTVRAKVAVRRGRSSTVVVVVVVAIVVIILLLFVVVLTVTEIIP